MSEPTVENLMINNKRFIRTRKMSGRKPYWVYYIDGKETSRDIYNLEKELNEIHELIEKEHE